METHIPELRRQRRLSQADLATAVGVTRQTITSLETGKYIASLPLAARIARYFDRSIEDVFLIEPEKETDHV
jgi:putative transcriptional regulator